MLTTTLGQLLINEALPEEMQDHRRVMDKKGIKDLMREVAEKRPDEYASIARKLMLVGQSASTTGNFSFSLKDFQPPAAKRDAVAMLKIKARLLMDNPKIDQKAKEEGLVKLLGSELDTLVPKVFDQAHKSGNQLAAVIHSGSKGNPSQFNTTVGAPLLYLDHKDKPVPIPVFNSVSEGLDPAEYWASTYGTRKGMLAVKMSVAESGYFGKKLALASNRLVVTEHDCGTPNGIRADGNDKENVGTILVQDAAGIKAGTVIKPEHLAKLKGTMITVRSPMTCQASDGLCSRCAGVRERGTLPDLGDNLGVTAASALSERLTQILLSSKHSSGAASAKKSYTYEDVERLFEMPKSNVEFAPVAEEDGVVKSIAPSPAGGFDIKIGDHPAYWSATQDDIKVKLGQHIEAGEVLTAGIPHPALLAKHRGIGDARRTFVDNIREVTGNNVSRRNAEVLSRAMISHVNVTGLHGPHGAMVGDTTRYDDLVRGWEPRPDSKELLPSQAKGQYLEMPALHYTIGTQITDRMIKDLHANGIKNITVHKDSPGFEPDVQRMFAHSQLDPDWMTRMSGYHLGSSLPDAVHRGMTSEEHSTSFVPALAKGVDFGSQIKETGKY